MNFLFDDVVTRSRAVIGLAVLSMIVSCAGPQKVALDGPEVFDLSLAERRARFPKVQNIGVVELSGSRVNERPFEGGPYREYVANGGAGALLVKKVEPPILAYGAEITVTPDLAMVSGKGVVKQGDRLFIGESETSRIVIDGVMVSAEGPHREQTVSAWKKEKESAAAASLLAAVTPAVETPEPVAAPVVPKPKKVVAGQKREKVSPRVSEAPEPVVVAPKKTPAVPVKKNVAETPKKVTAPAVAKVNPKPVPVPAAKPAADRSQLLNLMREPKE